MYARRCTRSDRYGAFIAIISACGKGKSTLHHDLTDRIHLANASRCDGTLRMREDGKGTAIIWERS